MSAPKAKSIFTTKRRVIGVQLDCLECSQSLRVETAADYPAGKCPDIVGHAGGLGFVVRCDGCGCRIEMKGNRLPSVGMIRKEQERG